MAATDAVVNDWREALSAVMDAAAASYRELPEKLAAAEAFLRRHIAELESRAPSDRLAQFEEQQRNFAYWTVAVDGRLRALETQAPEQTYVQNPLCCAPFAAFSGMVHCGKPAGHTDGHAALNEHHHVTVWGRPEQYEALPQPAPRPQFDGLFSTGGVFGQPAPDHLSEGRLPKRDLATGQLLEQVCLARHRDGRDVDANCARQRHHDGPHMDQTAIAHAGKAGEVWT